MFCLTEDLSHLPESLVAHEGRREPGREMARVCLSPGGCGHCEALIGCSHRSGRKAHYGLLSEGNGIVAYRCGVRDAVESAIVRVLKDC